ncbi:hypothetical protein [Heliobacterium chlorum]|uniref:hypothetical protein n=1 Tax=Heliobacterium chlorum TaxID=2698 RepID=UPI00165D69B3|nr:hypothetical protein [Heliobacterium chlorum]
MALRLHNCSRCERVFIGISGKLCPECIKKQDAALEKVRDYLYDHPGASVQEVIDETGIDEKEILELVKIGYICFENSLLRCSRCGITIERGSHCSSCQRELIHGLHHATASLNNNEQSRAKIYAYNQLQNKTTSK